MRCTAWMASPTFPAAAAAADGVTLAEVQDDS